MAAWRNWALRIPVIKHWHWQHSRTSKFTVGDIVLEAPWPQVSKSVRKSLRKNEYETAEAYLVRQLVRPGDTVLDLGTGLGLTAIAAAKASGGGRIVSYEADAVISAIAERNARRNDAQVEIRNKAIAKEKGVRQFHVRRSFAASSLVPLQRAKRIVVEADAFRDVVNEIQPDVLVCDVEGIEKDLFTCADLSSVQRSVVEVHPQIIGVIGVVRFVQDMAALGLSWVEFLSFGQVLVFDRDGSSSSIVPFRPRRPSA